MATLTTYNLGSIVEGDSWEGISSYHITHAAQDYGTNLVQVNMTLKGRAGMGAGYLYLSSATGDGTINNAGNWTFTINHIHDFPLPKDTYDYAIETIDNASPAHHRVLLKGTLIVTDPITP